MKLPRALQIILFLTTAVAAFTEANVLNCKGNTAAVVDAINAAKDVVELVVDTHAGIVPDKGYHISSAYREELHEFFFGALSQQDRDYVKGVFIKMNDSLDTMTWTCAQDLDDCNRWGAGAYVSGGLPNITICPVHFSDSFHDQTRRMIHEATHVDGISYPHSRFSWTGLFDVFRSSEHGVYRLPRAAQLAKCAPKAAMFNADNYALYAMQLSYAHRTGREVLPEVVSTESISSWAAWIDARPDIRFCTLVAVSWPFIFVTLLWLRFILTEILGLL
ncbi:uncharacterized protein CLAFUR5_07904 [Fulvia fulva]|uniref:Lysine-specific metallo-endopeptidase domain-containing protein n=1 Tax=Passalora fulva TaxID=5499 RepID=A0A9Q8LDZ9_PASFU|nr:uncharacterized protein CLAFUR5_07904 [Fulvia fulva]KAK4630010.1 hypothetical protein CLAFUR0_07781 [Fulvia fulva]UJO15671.1 hypothetical protein CLAFUR5_07904 [Fulvia fulva]